MESIFRLYSELPRHKKDALIFFAGIHTVLLIIIIFLLILVLSNLLNSSSFFIVLILLGIISFFASFGFYNDWKRAPPLDDIVLDSDATSVQSVPVINWPTDDQESVRTNMSAPGRIASQELVDANQVVITVPSTGERMIPRPSPTALQKITSAPVA